MTGSLASKAGLPVKKSKYRNVKTVVDGVTFDSQKESSRWVQLRLMERAGLISELDRQTVFRLHVNGTVIGKIIPDFTYIRDGEKVVEDVKSAPTMTRMFRWKQKHLLLEYGIKLEIV